MKKTNINFWNKLSLSHKISCLGSIALILSLFLNWFSDVDVFRSGDTYTGLNGPLYFVGVNIFILATINLIVCLGKGFKAPLIKEMSAINLGKYQMIGGFFIMYLLIIVNSIYFSTQFGLNILSKRSEIGVLLAMLASVSLCVAGYISYRKKFDLKIEQKEEQIQAVEKENFEETAKNIGENDSLGRAFNGGLKKSLSIEKQILNKEVLTNLSTGQQKMPENSTINQESKSIYSERNIGGKTDYEKAQMYENLKKMMMKDTMSPAQRRKEREKEINQNAFSASFGKVETKIPNSNIKNTGDLDDLLRKGQFKKANAAEKKVNEVVKKPQMYRIDL